MIKWQTYLIFEGLMKAVIGRYMLKDYANREYLNYPDDFINLDDGIITWHSDGNTDNVLKIAYVDDTIKISILKSEKANRSSGNIVRVRTSGSDYGYYFQEFLDFYQNLLNFEQSINVDSDSNIATTSTVKKRKVLSFFGR